MGDEIDPNVIRATQVSLGKYIKRPPLSDKLLRKPPFRFLHDIVTSVLKSTGFFNGLFEEDELISDNVKDRDSKIIFLNKVISVVNESTGKSISVKPSKIVAGQEPEKTNLLLQCLAEALDKKISSEEAVNKFKTSNSSGDKVTKEKSPVKPAKKVTETKKTLTKNNENSTKVPKDASNTAKQKENTSHKKESPPKKPLQKSVSVSKNTTQRNNQESNAPLKSKQKTANNIKINKLDVNSSDTYDKKMVKNNVVTENDNISTADAEQELIRHETNYKTSDEIVIDIPTPQLKQQSPNTEEEIKNIQQKDKDIGNLDERNKLNSTKPEIFHVQEDNKLHIANNEKDVKENDISKESTHIVSENNPSDHDTRNVTDKINIPDKGLSDEINDTNSDNGKEIARPASMRPSSSRPGAPRLRGKNDNMITGADNIVVGKVNIIVENAEEEEDSSIVIIDNQIDVPPTSEDHNHHQTMHLPSNQHGHLVQQILESQKELSEVAGSQPIEWQFGSQKARDVLNKEMEQLRFNVQALSRVANPLGKLLDHIQEDVEVMRQELQQWSIIYEQTSKNLMKQKTANEESLLPLNTKIKQLNLDIEEKREKINDHKIIINKNAHRIEKLLASGVVQ